MTTYEISGTRSCGNGFFLLPITPDNTLEVAELVLRFIGQNDSSWTLQVRQIGGDRNDGYDYDEELTDNVYANALAIAIDAALEGADIKTSVNNDADQLDFYFEFMPEMVDVTNAGANACEIVWQSGDEY